MRQTIITIITSVIVSLITIFYLAPLVGLNVFEKKDFKPFYPTPTGEPITEIRSVNLLIPEVANQVIREEFK